jgi:hypothetical protein
MSPYTFTFKDAFLSLLFKTKVTAAIYPLYILLFVPLMFPKSLLPFVPLTGRSKKNSMIYIKKKRDEYQ